MSKEMKPKLSQKHLKAKSYRYFTKLLRVVRVLKLCEENGWITLKRHFRNNHIPKQKEKRYVV